MTDATQSLILANCPSGTLAVGNNGTTDVWTPCLCGRLLRVLPGQRLYFIGGQCPHRSAAHPTASLV
jgi:hypothetical protein